MKSISLAFLACAAMASAQNDYFVKQLVFPETADSAAKVEMASRLVPTDKQLEWQNLELTAFLHFGVNTFTDREWGDGTEDPSIFNPSDLDADQWVESLKAAGFKMAIITAKHHDGFCLWPTATTAHSVASSPWRDGHGDVVAELADACRRHGMKLGIYLSPWDRNAPCYGDSPAYNDMFVAQLTELLTNYGKVDEVWFDGACGEGPNGRKQEYDWARFKNVMETLQPEAVLAIMGDDVRWVGNEKGQGRETEWSATALVPGILPEAASENARLGLYPKAPDLGGREILVRASRLYWWPSEVDVSIRPGWFWHATESPKSLRQLAEIYLNSVGRNSVLLLNVPPDRRGRIAEADSIRLAEFGRWVADNFSAPAAPGETVNCVVLREDLRHGQRVESFNIKASDGGRESIVASGTTIGNKRIVMFDPVEADSVFVEITSQRGEPHLLPVQCYNVALPEEIIAGDFPRLPANSWAKHTDGSTVIIDFTKPTACSGIAYMPDESDGGYITHYKLAASDDAINWAPLPSSGEFSNIVNNPIEQIVMSPSSSRYIRMEVIESTAPLNLKNVRLSVLK